MGELRISSVAERDFTEALCWYADRSPCAAEGFDAEFEAAIDKIGANPQRFRSVTSGTDLCLMHRYPYQIIYREESHGVVVIAVGIRSKSPDIGRGDNE